MRALGDRVMATRDGVRLAGDLYRPGGAGPLPAIAIRQPYGKRTPEMGLAQVGGWFARKGYACLVQDVRGKFGSEGAFDPAVHEVEDGYDTVAWLVEQPWCDGRVGLWGESYYGFTSLAAAVSGHPAVRAIAPGDIAADRRASWWRQGALTLNTFGYWALAMDAQEYADVAAVDPWHLPLRDLPLQVELEGAFFRAALEHAEDAAWWANRSLADRLDRIGCAVLSWTGWYDVYVAQQLADFVRLQAVHPHPERLHLLAGPWDHEASSGLADRAACLPVPDTEQHRWDTFQAFFDRYLREDDNGFGAGGRAEVFTLGPMRWRRTGTWPPPEATPTPLYLHAGGVASFAPPDGDEAPDRYRYDPLDPLDESVGGNCWALAGTLTDRRRHDARSDVLRYVSDPVPADLELTGPVSARLHATTSAPDTDFTVTLCHVLADGTVNTIQDGIVRTRFRDWPARPSLVAPGEAVAYDVDLAGTSYVVPAGDRLRVDVSSSASTATTATPTRARRWAPTRAPPSPSRRSTTTPRGRRTWCCGRQRAP